MTEILTCPICDKEIDYIPKGAHYDLTRHLGSKHDPIEIIKSYVNYYLEAQDFPLDELNWSDE